MIITVTNTVAYRLFMSARISTFPKIALLSDATSSAMLFVKMILRALISELFVSHFSQSREDASVTVRGEDVSLIRREVVSSWRTRKSEGRKPAPEKVGRSRWIFTNSPTYTPYTEGRRVCARVLHIPYSRRWASLDASVANRVELCRARQSSRGYQVQEKQLVSYLIVSSFIY